MYELVTKPTADNLQLENNSLHLVADTEESSLDHHHDVIPGSDDVKAKKK